MNNNFILKDSDKIEFSVEGKGYIKVYPPLTDIEITPTKDTQTFKNSEEYGYDHVTVKPIPETYINPTGSLTINENGVKNVRDFQNVVVDVKAEIPEGYIKPEGTLNITENGEKDVATYKKVNVNVETVIPEEYIIPTGTKTITENGTTNVREYENVDVNIEIPEVDLQEKSITPTKDTQEVTPDLEFDGLGKVTVNPIPDEYIIPDGTLPITENNTFDVTKYARVTTSVRPAPNLQAKSIDVNENGVRLILADEGYDGLSQVEIATSVEGSGGGGGGVSVDPTTSIYDLLMNTSFIIKVENYPTITENNITLYTPSADNMYYMIRKRSEGYGIIWFPMCILTTTGSTTINTRTVDFYIKTDGINNINDGKIQANDLYVTGYMANFNTLEECVEAMQNPNTVYTTANNCAWGSEIDDNNIRVSATNLPCFFVNGSRYLTADTPCGRISKNETIEVIS